MRPLVMFAKLWVPLAHRKEVFLKPNRWDRKTGNPNEDKQDALEEWKEKPHNTEY